MPIDDDRQSKTNNRTGVELAFLEAVDAIEVPFTPLPAIVERAERNHAEHEHAKVHGFKATRNRAISAWRKTDEGKIDRNKADRIAYAVEAARQGDVVRTYAHLTGMTDEQKATRVRKQNAAVQKARRKNMTDNMTEEELTVHRSAESQKRAARRAKAKNS